MSSSKTIWATWVWPDPPNASRSWPKKPSSRGWSHIEFLARVIGEQATSTVNRKLAARLRFARFPFRRNLADFDFEFQPSVDRKLIDDLATLRFIEENQPILFLGQPGTG